jgi:futalosine hydrolase
MRILLVAATEKEIGPTVRYLDERLYLPKQLQVDLLISGIGSMGTTYALMRQLSRNKPDLALQAGVGGSFHPLFTPGMVVSVKEEIPGDLGVMERDRWHTLSDMGLTGPDDPPFKHGRLPNPHHQLLEKAGLHAVPAITVNRISTETLLIRQWKERFTPVVESMEGAAFHFVCLQESIPFLQLRSISNKVGERDKSKWELQKSIDHLNEHLIRLLHILTD